MSTKTKDQLHRLVDSLAANDVETAGRVLVALVDDDPVDLSLILAPLDDEPLTDEDRAALDEAYVALARGDVVVDEALRQWPNRSNLRCV